MDLGKGPTREEGDLMSESLQNHHDRIKELEVSLEHVLARLHQLEEKERARSWAEHQKEESLDFENAEGLSRL